MDVRVQSAPAADATRAAAHGCDRLAMLLLAGVVAVSRLPLWGSWPGEPDSALFPIGLWRWTSAGPLASRIYDREFSPGYYWLAAHVAQWGGWHFADYPKVLSGMSVMAAVAAAPLAYLLARQLLPVLAAFWATLVWLLAPGVWWLGIEPHPQAPGIALVLAALAAHSRALRMTSRWRAVWWAASCALLAAAMAVRSDAVFLSGGFFLPWLGTTRPGRRAAAGTAAMLAAAVASFWPLRAWMVGTWRGAPAGEPGTLRRILGYWGHLSPAHQLLPFLTCIGVGAGVLAAAGWLSLPRAERRRWLGVIVLWSLPASLFWILVRGNNTRHVALCVLPLLWAGAAGWSRWRRLGRRSGDRVAAAAVLALGLGLAIPANPNVTLYPSGDVPLSARLLRRQEAGLYALGAKLAAEARPPCFLGSFTSTYVLLGALRAGMRGGEPVLRLEGELPHTVLWRRAQAYPLEFRDVYSAADYRAVAAACGASLSLEYSPGGQPRHPMRPAWAGRGQGIPLMP